jgi:hypothetical protein
MANHQQATMTLPYWLLFAAVVSVCRGCRNPDRKWDFFLQENHGSFFADSSRNPERKGDFFLQENHG